MNPKETSLVMELDYLRTSMATLRLLVPNLNLPPNFDKLDNLDFEGNFLGFYSDFVADGYLKTDLGDARMDLQVSKVKNGFGLSLETANANLEASIPNFSYKGYTYQNISMNGKLDKNNFSGDFVIKDDNIDFNFVGSITSLDTLPDYKFEICEEII